MSRAVSVILPTLNESGHIRELGAQLLALLETEGWQAELLVVDDGSSDGTVAVVEALAREHTPGRVRLLLHQPPRGLADSLRLGTEAATADTIVLMDADFNHRPEDVPRLLQVFAAAGSAAVVSGSRFLPGGGMPGSTWRRLGSAAFNRLARQLLFSDLTDYLAGFVVFDRGWLSPAARQEIFCGYGDYCLRLLVWLHRSGVSVREIPVSYGMRPGGSSHTRPLAMLPQYLRTLLAARRIARGQAG